MSLKCLKLVEVGNKGNRGYKKMILEQELAPDKSGNEWSPFSCWKSASDYTFIIKVTEFSHFFKELNKIWIL